jgi:hypothetical protein
VEMICWKKSQVCSWPGCEGIEIRDIAGVTITIGHSRDIPQRRSTALSPPHGPFPIV